MSNLNQDTEQKQKGDLLYFNFRYRKGSYKAKKCGLQPILMMAKRGNEKLRLYGEAGACPTAKQMQFAVSRFRTWRQKERELRRLTKINRRNPGSLGAGLHVAAAG
jgi:hypothetical protein